MGDRIVVRLTDGTDISPALYCHWAGLRIVKDVHDILRESNAGISNMMCNLVVKAMQGRMQGLSYYLYNAGECESMADFDEWTWTFDIRTETWETTMPGLKGRRLTVAEAEAVVMENRPCLYRDCPCERYDDPEVYCGRRMQELVDGRNKGVTE